MSLLLPQLDPQDPNFAVEVIDRLIPAAMQRDASDIHLQPRDNGWEVLFRIDGVLSAVGEIQGGGAGDPVARLMVLAGLPTYRSGRPMEGRVKWEQLGTDHPRSVSMRIGIFPTVHGPRAVIRFVRSDERFDEIASLGLDESQTRELAELCASTDGAVLLSGPAGSGKTTTMYAMLRDIAAQTPRRSVVTIEDPVETVIDSISQSELDVSAGMTLSSALRSAVRQDSEVLLVSEIRDPETAEAALQASLTGHLVFSSLHATDVAASLRRLVQLGVPTYVVQSGVRAIVSQRLLRHVCRSCHGSSPESRKGQSCSSCSGTGYRGRFPIAQCTRFDGADPAGDAMLRALEENASAPELRRIANSVGGMGLWQRARDCVADGRTDEAEVYRVLGVDLRNGPAINTSESRT